MSNRLGVAIVGSGFIAEFHVRAFRGVRDADVVAVGGRNQETVQRVCDLARELRVGDPVGYADVRELVRDPAVDAVWITTPNHVRLETVRAITEEVRSGRARLRGIAIEKPLGRTVAEAAEVVRLVEEAGLLHGYLENQVFAPGVTRAHELVWARGASAAGSPYLARCAEEHSGPHRAWFWQGDKQGGGVLNDMMCHSMEAGRFLLTPPGVDMAQWLTPISVDATIASLKWSRPAYADDLVQRYGPEVDYRRSPSEDYARATVVYRNGDGDEVIVEGTTSWSYVGAGLRLTFELLGPEYAMSVNSLDTEAKVFLSREIAGKPGEDLVEKQNAEGGLMPVLPDEPGAYGYTEENRHMVTRFLDGVPPAESLHDGLLVTRLLMGAYRSAQEGRRVDLTGAEDLDHFTPDVAQGTWRPRG
ncbi:Gfo/Idh/MocA family protein [Marinactinospora thermotolerans]|uniref:Predicted dehydrogenase n=1 Tax=Marinactinospora thermotolerans DSM 45154 TaxID=1122192 RepID=A0A1T4M077_9ACTN|nr:Gfo/Idh/MocA family oxidoreductase [Marinactinospora thermotolerans]SJZ60305.1 Predicted dehydrogenase [Marinactinospora thermotolerans DSM 45154]